MSKRIVTVLAALIGAVTLCACAQDEAQNLAGVAGGYTLEVRADEHSKIYAVIAPDGRRVAAQTVDGVSTLLDDVQIQALAPMPAAAPAPGEEEVSVRAPGFSLSVSGGSDADGEGGGNVAISLGGQSVVVNAEEGGVNDRANVRIAGVDAAAALDFIEKADTLSPEVRAQMRAALGL